MQNSSIVKLPQAGLPEQPILIHINHKASNELDIDLLATDGNTIYRGKLRERNYNKFRSANYDGTNEQWATILKYTFVSKQSSGLNDLDRQNLDVTCTVNADSANLTITFVTRIEDIVHRLGAIELGQSEDESDADLFEWNCRVIDQRDEHEQLLLQKVAEEQAAQKVVTALKKQLDELTKAKEDHESQLLAKFTLLLNEKKLKIRNQQRLLKTAKVDPGKLAAMQRTGAEESRNDSSNKRRREMTDEVEQEEDGDEEMQDADSVDEVHTTDTETDDGNDLEEVAGPPDVSRSKAKVNDLTPPPTRPLPFQKKGTEGSGSLKAASTPAVIDDEETASEDDEL